MTDFVTAAGAIMVIFSAVQIMFEVREHEARTFRRIEN
jgi:hypothetical protein